MWFLLLYPIVHDCFFPYAIAYKILTLMTHWMKQSFEKIRMYFYCRLKIVLAQLIFNYVEALQDVKSGPSSVRVRLTYTETKPSIIPSKSVDRMKRRKTGMRICLHVIENLLFSCKWTFLPWSSTAVNPLIFLYLSS